MFFKAAFTVVLVAFSVIAALGQDSATDHFNRGIEWRNEAEYEKALAEFNKAIDLDPKMSDAYYERGTIFMSLRTDPEKAISDLTKAIDLDQRNYNAFFNRAVLFEDKKDFDKAIDDLTKYIQLNPREMYESASGFIERGKCYVAKNSLKEAISDFTKAINAFPKDKKAYVERAIAYDKAGDREKADADRKIAETLN